MKFSEFLTEKTSHRTSLTKDEIVKIFKENCSNAHPDYPFWRGMRGNEDGIILEGQARSRRSINNSNHYTIAMDHFIKKRGNDLPLRSACTIAGSNNMLNQVHNFGPDIYAIFPFDGVKIGVSQEMDLWGYRFPINGHLLTLNKLNGLYQDANITDSDYFSFVRELKKYIEENKEDSDDKLVEIFGDDVDGTLKQIYDTEMEFNFVDSKEMEHISSKEVWIGGKCLAIAKDVYREIKKDLFF